MPQSPAKQSPPPLTTGICRRLRRMQRQRRLDFSACDRLLGLVALMLVPWLILVVYTQADERKAAIASVNGDALRLIRIVTSNQPPRSRPQSSC